MSEWLKELKGFVMLFASGVTITEFVQDMKGFALLFALVSIWLFSLRTAPRQGFSAWMVDQGYVEADGGGWKKSI